MEETLFIPFKAKKDGFKLRICPSAIAFSDQNILLPVFCPY
jgi:hypothetical protein